MPEGAAGDRNAAILPGLELREGGIARLALGDPGEGSALLGTASLEALEALLDRLGPLVEAREVRAVVVCGERPGAFVAGSDVDELRDLRDAGEATRRALAGQRALRRLEELPVPTVAAIDGACLEAGLELALACSYRLASDSSRTRLGLPQVRLGLMPAFGGTVRLPRLIGIQAALDLILPGRVVDADEALRLGLVDRVLPARRFLEEAEAFAAERVERGRIRTGARRPVPRRLLEDTAPGRRLVFARAARALAPRKEGAPPPAAERALRAVSEGVGLPLERAFLREAELAGELMVSAPARALLHASGVLRRARRPTALSEPRPVERVGVLGAGSVGTELAALLTSADLPVLLKDRRRDALLRGVRHVSALLARGEGEAAGEGPPRGELVASASGFGGFGTLDLVVAAVGASAEAAEEALREAEEHVRRDCVLASASLAASPGRLQRALEHPDRGIGLRFARPADLFPLLEIVPGEATGRAAIDACLDLARRLRRVPVVVPDRPDTPGNRLLGILFAEALRLVEEGAAVGDVDGVAEGFGLPLGPFRRMDAMGVERCVGLLRLLAGASGERMAPSPVVERLTGEPLLFYRYRGGLPRRPNAGLPRGVGGGGAEHAGAIGSRLLLSLVNEAARVLEEQPSLGPGEVDAVALAGLGFPRRRGGPLYHADRIGAEVVVERLREHAERFGERFEPAPLLRERAENGGSFHGAATGHAAPAVLR